MRPCHAPDPDAPPVSNVLHQHAFTILGAETFFGVHMTQYHEEVHKYQLVLRFSLPPEIAAGLRRVMAQFPRDLFVLANDDGDAFNIPSLAAGLRSEFTGNIFQGLPDFPPDSPFPWAPDVVRPVFGGIPVTVERIVTFRPFSHADLLPEKASYLMFGKGAEAHMTNLQTALIAPGKDGQPLFGPGYDHVLSLSAAPDWIAPEMLESGIVVSVPSITLRDPDTGEIRIPCDIPIKEGEELVLDYRGLPREPALTVTAGPSPWCATGVCNSEELPVCPEDQAIHASKPPAEYIVGASHA
ncbi:hypothetical protein SAMN04487972_1094 [Paracoccus halophilus]|uniref:SET domain-containing protein n=1 Tax=Paracoccus halophilus TaxID=376733 RepID=A0A099F170_9RHOB|nr:hypothetical protein [Paracoccus halophilus]KGJ04209.1 hypothetical protein IT41_10935 [Paracoccus halophilus]SFA51833.1 hypothetical protein SAMN04487972_1094 [Paracoccus halophilus]